MAFGEGIKWKLKELHQFRYMFSSLVKRNLFGKYRNSALGFLWNFATPAISVFLFFIVFENFMGGDIEHYWAYLCIGMFSFNFLNVNLIGGASNITSNSGMIKKMYFPREILALSQVTYTMIVFLISYAIIILLMLFTGAFPGTGGLLALPIVIGAMFIFSLGAILTVSAISVYSRDFQYLITALARVLFWVTPIFYMADSLSGMLSKVIWFNPLTYYVESLHYILYWGFMPSLGILLACIILALVTLVIGLVTFGKLEDGFVERL